MFLTSDSPTNTDVAAGLDREDTIPVDDDPGEPSWEALPFFAQDGPGESSVAVDSPTALYLREIGRTPLLTSGEVLHDHLTSREARIIQWRFGLRGAQQQTLAEIGERLGVSHERARQLELTAMCKLRHAARALKLLHDYA